MILPIVLYGNDVLRQQAKPVNVEDLAVQELIANMFETMYNARGVGLAAPQIGKSLSIFVMDSTALAEEGDALKMAVINPKLVSQGGEELEYSEGCLSIPNIYRKVYRPSEVEIAFQDEKGVHHQKTFSGINARIMQHEFDHLIGKFFIDYLSIKEKSVLKSKLKAVSEGKVNVEFPVKL